MIRRWFGLVVLVVTLPGFLVSANAQTKLWNDRAKQRELEMTREQRQKLLEIKLDYEDAVEELRREVVELSEKRYERKLSSGGLVYLESQREIRLQIQELEKRIAEIGVEYSTEANRVLLPFQRRILSELAVRRLISQGFILQMTSGRLDRLLDIDPQQKKRIQAKKKEMENRMQEAIAKLLVEFKEEILAELDSKQRDIVRNALEDYEYRTPNDGALLRFELFFFKKKSDR